MVVRTPTVKREWRVLAQSTATPPQDFAIRTIQLRHRFTTFNGWERQFTTLVGTIHKLDPSIHNLVHNFWQGKRSNGDLCSEIAILTVRPCAVAAVALDSRSRHSTSPMHHPPCHPPLLAAASACHCPITGPTVLLSQYQTPRSAPHLFPSYADPRLLPLPPSFFVERQA
jgi:hypothetical protein